MKTNNFFSDLASMASSTAGGLLDAKRELDDMISAQLEKLLNKMNLVTKEEFDTLNQMTSKLLIENQEIKKRLDALEKGKNP